MNWLLLMVAVFIGYHVIDGFHHGFIRKAVSAVSLVLSLVLVTYVTPPIANFIENYTSLSENLQEKCTDFFVNDSYDENIKTDQVLMIENMDLPENIKELLLENNNGEVYEVLDVSGFREYVGAYMANLIINAVTYLLAFIIVWAAIRIVLVALDIVTMLPVLHGINKLAGGGLGLAVGVVLVWIAFLLVTIFSSGDVGQKFFELISESPVLSFLYKYNVIMKIVNGLIF